MKKYLFFILMLGAIPSFAVWDVTTPAGSEAKSLGDDRIREFKTDIQTALQYEGDFPGSDTSNPRFIYTPSTGTTSGRPTGNARATGMLYVNKTSGTVEQYNGSSWEAIAFSTNYLPSGTKSLFVQSACPNGWTQDTSFNAQLARVTSGTGGGTGGTSDPATTVTLAHTHSTPDHSHPLATTSVSDAAATITTPYIAVKGGGNGHTLATYANGAGTSRESIEDRTTTSGAGNTGSSLSDLNLAYFNVIVCTKN